MLIAPVQEPLPARGADDPGADEGVGVDGFHGGFRRGLLRFARDQLGHPGGEVACLRDMMGLGEEEGASDKEQPEKEMAEHGG